MDWRSGWMIVADAELGSRMQPRVRWPEVGGGNYSRAFSIPAMPSGPWNLHEKVFAAWTEVLHRGWEGYVAKDPESPYVGGRTLRWLKVKQPRYREGEHGWEPKGTS